MRELEEVVFGRGGGRRNQERRGVTYVCCVVRAVDLRTGTKGRTLIGRVSLNAFFEFPDPAAFCRGLGVPVVALASVRTLWTDNERKRKGGRGAERQERRRGGRKIISR